MCAINGFNFKDEDLIRKMNQLTRHRGPDDTGVFLHDNMSLGHNRLSIIDLSSAGHQPMQSEDKNLTIVFNGEIYNFQELKEDLMKKGYNFFSKTDTEVILKAYKEYGRDCVKKFNGIFAFAVFDAEKGELFLARDHIGVKPLYYFWDGGKIIFSSEIKAILAHGVSREVDLTALNHYLRLSYIPGVYTIFKSIKKLPAANFIFLKDGKLEIEKYWKIEDRSDISNKNEAQEKIKDLMEDSARKQIISDRPVGVFLSGGVDSSVVLGLVRKFGPKIVKTFTTGFEVNVQKEKYNADFELARNTAKHYNTNHNELIIKQEDVANNLEKIIWHLDEPNGNHTAPLIFLLSQYAKKEVAVVLGGDGGDELFGGYDRYRMSQIISNFQKMPKVAQAAAELFLKAINKKKYVEKLKSFPGVKRYSEFMFQKEELLSSILKPEIYEMNITNKYFFDNYFNLPENDLKKDFEKIFMDTDRQTWLADDSLLRSDKMSMAYGLEARVPILDSRLVELSQKIPTNWKIKGKEGKVIFKEAFKDCYLPHLTRQPKRGWFSPMAKWLREEPLRSISRDVLTSLPREYFSSDFILKIWEEHLTGKVYNLNILWFLISFGIWYDIFIKH